MKLILPSDGHITAFIYILQITSNNTTVIPAPPLSFPPPPSFPRKRESSDVSFRTYVRNPCPERREGSCLPCIILFFRPLCKRGPPPVIVRSAATWQSYPFVITARNQYNILLFARDWCIKHKLRDKKVSYSHIHLSL
jgi:hypothetical protein